MDGKHHLEMLMQNLKLLKEDLVNIVSENIETGILILQAKNKTGKVVVLDTF